MTANTNHDIWASLNQALLAKSISELHFEEAIAPNLVNDDVYEIAATTTLSYQFKAKVSYWDYLQVVPGSICRIDDKQVNKSPSADQFFIDLQDTLALAPITLSNWLEELYQTLWSDLQLNNAYQNEHKLNSTLLEHPEYHQCRLNGHPKAILNKGRLGWGIDELRSYAPESSSEFKLFWIAACKTCCISGMQEGIDDLLLLKQMLNEADLRILLRKLKALNISIASYHILPVHPWQWQKVIATQFQGEIQNNNIIPLGKMGDHFLPQQSVRTLSNTSRPKNFNVKLPITILNTSCYRGIPSKYIEVGGELSDWLSRITAEDPVLSSHRIIVLEEKAGISYKHPSYDQIEGAPYRYNESLGVIWRESIVDKVEPSEKAILYAELLHQGFNGSSHERAKICEYIKASGLCKEVWLQKLFYVSVIPLYHFLCRYGLGFVAHSQNIIVVLKDNVPSRIAIKDLHGDCRLVDRDFPESRTIPESVKSALTKLPPEYLIHDLYTGHFVTVLRYLSAALADDEFTERQFYQLLAQEIKAYQDRSPELHARFSMFDILAKNMHRVCINRVRFKIGYGDNGERPLPELGSPLNNPLYKAMKHQTHPLNNYVEVYEV